MPRSGIASSGFIGWHAPGSDFGGISCPPGALDGSVIENLACVWLHCVKATTREAEMRLILSSILFAVVSLAGCANNASIADPALIQDADYGPYPQNLEETVKNHFSMSLFDPFSAQYQIGKPYKGYLREAPIKGGEPTVFGYIVNINVNAKNRYGAYVGWKGYRLMIRDDGVVSEIHPNVWFAESWYQ